MRAILIIAITLFLPYIKGIAQSDNDSAMIEAANLAYSISRQKPDSAFTLADMALRRYLETGNKRVGAFALKARGWAFLSVGNYDSAFADLHQSEALFTALKDTLEIVAMYVNLANAYSNRNQYVISTKYLLMADSLAQYVDDPATGAAIKMQMGISYREQKQYAKAIPYFKECIEDFKTIKDTIRIINASGSLSILYMSLSRPDSSLIILNQCLPLIEHFQGAYYEKALTWEHFGNAYFALKSYGKALDFFTRAYKGFQGIQAKADEAYEAANIGKTYVELGDYKQGENYLMQSYHINDSLKIPNYTHDAAVELSKLYERTRDWHKAFQWANKVAVLRDSIDLASQNEKTAELQAEYEAGKKDQEIALLKKDKELRNTALQKESAVKAGAFILSGLLLVIGLLIANRNRVIHKARRMVEIEKLRNNIARDLHDDIGSTLSSIIINSSMALNDAAEKSIVKNQLEKIKKNSGIMMESMSDIVWAINPANDSLESLIVKMKEFLAEMLEPPGIQYTFNGIENIKKVTLDIRKRKEIYLIFKEAINNAAKYSDCFNVTLDLVVVNKQLQLNISDDGKGFDWDIIKPGNGLRNMHERATGMKGSLDIKSSPGKGTTIALTIPIT